MGKQQGKNQHIQHQEQNNGQRNQQTGKKIIKKTFFKLSSKVKKGQEDQLKDWRPKKISETVEQHKTKLLNEKRDLAQSFLHSLPKAKQEKKPVQFSFQQTFTKLAKPGKKMEITEEQRKWDIEDQSFIKKQFQKEQPKPIEHELVEQEQQDGTVVEKIKWLNQSQPIKEVDITKVIDNNWKQQVKKKDFQNDIWNSSLIKGKGQISQFVRDAINRFDEDEEAINRRQLNKNKMRNRYGW